MKRAKFNILLVFIVQIGFSSAQNSKMKQLHFYDGKNRNSTNSLDMEFHGDTLLYFRPKSVSISYTSDSIMDDSYVSDESDIDSTITERYFWDIRVVWKSSGKKDTITYEMISYKQDYRKGG